MEREHIAIRDEAYVAGTSGRPEVGVFTQTHAGRHPIPWGRIAPGETVWMKWASGPIVGQSLVYGVIQLESCTSSQLREEVGKRYRLYGLHEYWDDLEYKGRFDAIVVRLEKESWLDIPFEPHVPNRESWVVLDSAEKREKWLVPGAGAEIRGTRQAKARGQGTRSVSKSLRFQVLRRDNFRCVYCGRGPAEDGIRLHIDHVLPWSKGGRTVLENLKTSCRECNLGKGIKRI